MATPQQLAVLTKYYEAAKASNHIWPAMATCEAVLESSWGTSELAAQYHNLFGQKCPIVNGNPTPPLGVLKVSMPTWEVVDGHRIDMRAYFLWFTSDADAFTHRMSLLEGAADKYPEYKAALHATDPDDYVREVSKRWSTDPDRAEKCLEIYYAHRALLTPLETA